MTSLLPVASSVMPRARRMLTLLDPARIDGAQDILTAPDPLASDLLHLLTGRALVKQRDQREVDVTDDELGQALRQLRGAVGWSLKDYALQEQAIMAAGDVWLREELEGADYPRQGSRHITIRDVRFMTVTGRTLLSKDPVTSSEWHLMTGNWTDSIPRGVGNICLELAQLPWSGGEDGYQPAWAKALGKVLLAHVLGPRRLQPILTVRQLLTHARLPTVPGAQKHFESSLAALQPLGLHLGCGYPHAQQHQPWLERDVQFVIPTELTGW